MFFSKSIPDKKVSNVAARIVRLLPALITILFLVAAALNFFGTALGWLPAWILWGLDQLSNFSIVFLGIVIEALPFLLVGTLVSGFVEVYIDRDDLQRLVPRNPVLAVLSGGLLGLFFPVCECGVVPFARRLLRKGVPVSMGITLLLAAPVVNPVVIASTYAAFGPGPIFWGRIGISLAVALLTGMVFTMQADASELLRQPNSNPVLSPLVPLMLEQDALQRKKSVWERVREALIISVDEFFEMSRYLVIGASLAALMQTVVRQQSLLALGQGPVLSVILLIILAVLLSVCSTVDAFIALAFVGTFTSGSILAFLVYGPMVDIKSTLMYLRVFKPRTVVYLVGLPLLLTMIATILFNFFVPGM